MEAIQRQDVSAYTHRVTLPVEDNEFVATCAEFPAMSWLADSPGVALQGLVDVVADTVDDLVSQGEVSRAGRSFPPWGYTPDPEGLRSLSAAGRPGPIGHNHGTTRQSARAIEPKPGGLCPRHRFPTHSPPQSGEDDRFLSCGLARGSSSRTSRELRVLPRGTWNSPS